MKKNINSSRILKVVVRMGTMFEKSTGMFCVILFGWMLAITLLGVFFRYIMKNPFQWTEEVCRYTLIWLGFTAINIGIWRDEHIKLPFLVKKLPVLLAKCVAVAGHLLIALYLYVLLTKGYAMTVDTMMTAQSLSISMFWIYMAVPLSAALSLIQITLSLFRIILSPTGSPVN